jgi:hypothetical protein
MPGRDNSMDPASSTKRPKLPLSTYSASVSRLLRPILKGMKRGGLLKVAPRVQGKIMETESGTRFLVVEQKGRDLWRGRHKSLHDAIEAGVAGVAVDRILLARARDQQDVTHVMVVIEEQRRIFVAKIDDFFDMDLSQGRTDFRGRSVRILAYARLHQKYLGPVLHTKRKRSSA